MKSWTEIGEGSGDAGAIAAPAPEARRATTRGYAGWAALVALTVSAVAALGPMLGMHVPPRTIAVIAAGALTVPLAPARAFEITALAGVLALATTTGAYALYHLAIVGLLFAGRTTTWATAAVLGLLAIWLPKHLFSTHYHHPAAYAWINEPSVVLLLFVSAAWWRQRRDGRLPPATLAAPAPVWALMYVFPGHAVNPMVFSPGDVFRARRLDARPVLIGLALVAMKAAVHTGIARCFAQASFAVFDLARAAAASRAELWEVVAINYLDLVVTLSGTADVAVVLARLYGWPMPSPFRFALLAWNPVELWRRWGIYNRKLLLTLVYFPLGGNLHDRYRNVMLTFLGSALLLHTGWFGSKYWAVGPGGWRDQTAYFLVQGLLVCGCLLARDLRARGQAVRPPEDRALRWSWGRAAGTVATQAASALAHVIILAHEIPFFDRVGLMARCLGAPLTSR